MPDRPITLEQGVERIGQAQHGALWTDAMQRERQAFETRVQSGNTPKSVAEFVAAHHAVENLRQPIISKLIDAFLSSKVVPYRELPSGLLPIPSDHWKNYRGTRRGPNSTEDQPDVTISRELYTTYLYAGSLEAFIQATPTRAMQKLKNPIPKKGPRRAARLALDALYHHGIPRDKSGQDLTNAVNKWISRQPNDLIEGRVRQNVSLDTVLRAAERK